MSRSRIFAASALALLLLAAGCVPARAGTRCRSTDWGDDGTYVLRCERGKWVRKATKVQVAQLVIAIIRSRTTTTSAPTTTTSPPPAPVYAIASGYQHSCSIRSGAVWCVGRNNYGQLGNGTTTDSTAWVSTGMTGAVSVDAGSLHSCAVKADGTAWCWGIGGLGMLGDGGTTNSSSPVQVIGLTTARQITTGGNGSCATTSTGDVYCWGYAASGDGGVGVGPIDRTSISNVARVSAGSNHTCAVKTDTTVWCWGANGTSQLGDGTTTSGSYPVQVTVSPGVPFTGAVDVAAGGFDDGITPAVDGTSCAVKADGTVWCWGSDLNGLLGNGSGSTSIQPRAAQVAGVTGAAHVAIGFYQVCVVRAAGGGTCWGLNYVGQLGNGTSTASTSPVEVTGLVGATTISSGQANSCVLLATNAAKCWGGGDYGRLGTGTITGAPTPANVIGMP